MRYNGINVRTKGVHMGNKKSKNIIYVNGKPVDPDKDSQDIFGDGGRHASSFRTGKKKKTFRTGKKRKPLVTFVVVVICIAGILFANHHLSELIYSISNNKASDPSEVNLDSDSKKTDTMQPDGTLPDVPYTAPADLGEKLSDGRIQMDGKIYQLPIPYSVLAEDGWTFTKPEYAFDNVANANTKVKPHETIYDCLIQKGDFPELSVQLTNFSSRKAPASECAVTNIFFYMPYDKTKPSWADSISISSNLSFSVSENDFEQMMKTPELKKLEIGRDIYIDTSNSDGDTYKYFNIYFPEHDGRGGEKLQTCLIVSFRNQEMNSLTYSVDTYFSS